MKNDERKSILPPPECRSCARCIEHHGTIGDRYECQKDLPMHQPCGWRVERIKGAGR